MKQKYYIFLLITIATFFAVQGLWWFAFGLLVTGGADFTFLLAITIRVFLFEIYAIPSSSMEDTLITGNEC